jgi:hypothetical protein
LMFAVIREAVRIDSRRLRHLYQFEPWSFSWRRAGVWIFVWAA